MLIALCIVAYTLHSLPLFPCLPAFLSSLGWVKMLALMLGIILQVIASWLLLVVTQKA